MSNVANVEWYDESIHMELSEPDYLLHDANLMDAFPDGLKFSEELVTNEDSMQTTSNVIMINNTNDVNVDLQRRGPPERNIIETPFNFVVEINSNDTNKKKYLYSHRLNRIYVDRECDFSVQFNWDWSLCPDACLWVRACVVFADDAQAQKRPECCLQHLPQGNTGGGADRHIGLNVLHSSRPMGTHGVEYHGLADAADSWLSTVVALSKAGPQPVAHAYKFVCKSSCSSGINRRPIAVIFTLEDHNGAVLGRQMVGARVCSCPRRDMTKDEKSEGVYKAGKKRVAANLAQPKQPKKIKLELSENEPVPPAFADDAVLTLPPLDIVGDRAAITGLEVMVSMMQQAKELRRSDPQALEKYEASICKLTQTIQDIKNKDPSQ